MATLLWAAIDYAIALGFSWGVVTACELWFRRLDRVDDARALQRELDRIDREAAASVKRMSDAYLHAKVLMRQELADRTPL